MSKPNNEMIIHLMSGDELRLHRVAEPKTDAEPVVFAHDLSFCQSLSLSISTAWLSTLYSRAA